MNDRKCNCDNPLNCVTCLREDVAALQHENGTLVRQALVEAANTSLKANDELRRENASLKRSETFYRELARIHESHARGEYWAWQDEGENHLESLTCPVLIPAATLRAILDDLRWQKYYAESRNVRLGKILKLCLASGNETEAAPAPADAKTLTAHETIAALIAEIGQIGILRGMIEATEQTNDLGSGYKASVRDIIEKTMRRLEKSAFSDTFDTKDKDHSDDTHEREVDDSI